MSYMNQHNHVAHGSFFVFLSFFFFWLCVLRGVYASEYEEEAGVDYV